MKNIVFILTMFAFTNLNAQQVEWFAPGAHWEYPYFTFGADGQITQSNEGKEVKEGRLCTKLARKDHFNSYIMHTSGVQNLEPLYVYEQNDTVFLWENNRFTVLYDFTRQVGDSLAPDLIFNYSAVLESIGDTVLWDNLPTVYQKWKFTFPFDTSYYDYVYVYKGIGGNNFTHWTHVSPSSEYFPAIGCFRDDDHPLPACDFEYTEGYDAFPTGGATWSEEETVWCSFTGVRYSQFGDTTLAGIGTGKKLRWKNTYSGTWACPDPSATNYPNAPNNFLGILQQDAFNKKIWFTRNEPFYSPISVPFDQLFPLNQRVILYDFDIQPGDTVPWKKGGTTLLYNDSIQLHSGAWRKTYIFDDGFGQPDTTNYWIEGIGSNRGLFGSYIEPFTADLSQYLNCHWGYRGQSGFQKYHRIDPEYCDSTNTVSNKEIVGLDQIFIYPNPSNGHITIELPEEMLPAEIHIKELTGRTVFNKKQYTTLQNIVLEQSNFLQKGLFFIDFFDKNGKRKTQKIVVN